MKGLTAEQSEAMVRLSRLPAFKDLVEKVEADEVSNGRPMGAVVCSLTLRNCISNHLFCLLLQQFFMWIESNTPELAVPYLWSEEKQSSEYIHCVQTLRPSKKNKQTTVYIFV